MNNNKIPGLIDIEEFKRVQQVITERNKSLTNKFGAIDFSKISEILLGYRASEISTVQDAARRVINEIHTLSTMDIDKINKSLKTSIDNIISSMPRGNDMTAKINIALLAHNETFRNAFLESIEAFRHRESPYYSEGEDYFESVLPIGNDLEEATHQEEVVPLILQVTGAISEAMIENIINDPRELRKMPSRVFEEFIASVVEKFGFEVELTPRTRDGGRDIIAIGRRSIVTDKYLIECKRYDEQNKVGVEIVRALFGVLTDERATKGIIVTTSSFTKDAKDFIDRNMWRMEGKDLFAIRDWVKEIQRLRDEIKH